MQHPSHSTHIYHDIAEQVGLVPACVYGAIHWRAHLEHKACHASYATIGKELNIDERTVRRSVQKLIDAELVVLHLNPGGTNFLTLNEATPDTLTETPDNLSPELTRQLNKFPEKTENKEPVFSRDDKLPIEMPANQMPNPQNNKPKSDYWGDVEYLAEHFRDVTRLVIPALGTTARFKAANRLWLDPLKDIHGLCGDAEIAKQLVTNVVRKLWEDDLILSDPNSILKTARGMHAMGMVPSGRRYAQGQFADFWDA